MKYSTKKQLLKKSKDAIGLKFGDIDKNLRLYQKLNKGKLGHIIEESFFGYLVNSSPTADFSEIGVELKVTPFKQNTNRSFSSKERLVLSLINYMEDYKYEFFDSKFWMKNKSLLLFFYLHDYTIDISEFEIKHAILYEYPEEDLIIIKNDYDIIMNKIKKGEAHFISERDTMYLAACTKGKNKLTLREQPFSDIKAMQRAYSFKPSYMTEILRNYALGDKISDKIIKDYNTINFKTFETYIESVVKIHYKKTIGEIASQYDLRSSAKNINDLIIRKIFNITCNLNKTSEFRKAGITVKTITLDENGKIKESMSFPKFKFIDIYGQKYRESEIYRIFSTTKFYFVVFKKTSRDTVLQKTIFWTMDEKELEEEMRNIYENTKKVISKGNVISSIADGRTFNNFPKIRGSYLGHVRPHAKNKYETNDLPVKDILTGRSEFTNQCFWLNAKFLEKLVNE